MSSDKMQTRPAQQAAPLAKKTEERDRAREMLDKMLPQIAKILPKHLTPERMIQIIAVEMARNPELKECSSLTLASSIMLCSELGLEPSGPKGHAYLIPRWNGKTQQKECTVQIGYKGYIDLAYRSGRIARINAAVVYQPELDEGLFSASIEPPEINHAWSPTVKRETKEIVASYATALLKDGQPIQVILTTDEVEARRARSQAKGGPWVSDYAAMARKTAIRALLTGGLVPLSSEMAKALVEDATTADEGPVEPAPKQLPKPEPRRAGLLSPPDDLPEAPPPSPPASPLMEEVVAQIEKYPDRHQGVAPDWLPSAARVSQMTDPQLEALLQKMITEG
jgi:recombination protein RecT